MCAAFLAAILFMSSSIAQAGHLEVLGFEELEGWHNDDHQAALTAFAGTCDRLEGAQWEWLCDFAKSDVDAKTYFELLFRPVKEHSEEALFTGYFEPELRGSRTKSETYKYPLYRKPENVTKNGTYFDRRAIANGALEGKGLEIAWVDDPVELFFLQIQGSGRIRFEDDTVLRVGYAGNNGHKYKSVGRVLVARGIYNRHQVSAKVIQNWVKRNGQAGIELLNANPSYIFFVERPELSASSGPVGAMSRAIFPMRTIAVDPKFIELGLPVWVRKEGKNPFAQLMVAQDTGSAIKGANRADIFYGSGDQAGVLAGAVKDGGEMFALMPIFDLVKTGHLK